MTYCLKWVLLEKCFQPKCIIFSLLHLMCGGYHFRHFTYSRSFNAMFTLRGRCYYYVHFTDENTEARWGNLSESQWLEVTCKPQECVPRALAFRLDALLPVSQDLPPSLGNPAEAGVKWEYQQLCADRTSDIPAWPSASEAFSASVPQRPLDVFAQWEQSLESSLIWIQPLHLSESLSPA